MIKLAVDGREYVGWVSATIERSLDQFAHRFSLTYLDRWASEAQPWPILAGAECRLHWNSELLITGYVNTPTFTADGQQWMLTAAGRSKTGDLVDCSAVHETGEWRNRSALGVAIDLCDPFGIAVESRVPAALEPLRKFTLREGESVHGAIDRICKVQALLPRTNTAGNVELYSSDQDAGAVQTLPVASAISRTYRDDDSVRHSEYLTKATNIADQPDAIAHGAAKDTGVRRFRPLVVVGDAPAGTDKATLRAIWEANVRYGRGESVRYVVQGVEAPNGKSYQPGQKYRVQDDLFGLDLLLIVRRAVINVSESDITTTVELVRPETFSRFEFDRKKLTKKSKRKRRTRRPNL